MAGIDLSRFKAVFFEESAEHLAAMERALLRLEEDPSSPGELLDEIFRAAHSIKGASGTLGFDRILRFTHSVETLLDKMREGQAPVAADTVDLILRAGDVVGALVERAKDGDPSDPENLEEVLAEVDARLAGLGVATPGEVAADGGAEETEGAQAVWRIRFRPAADLFRQGVDPLLVVGELHDLGTVRTCALDGGAIPRFDALDPEVCHLSWQVELVTSADRDEIAEVFEFADYGALLEIERTGEAAGAGIAAADGDGGRRAGGDAGAPTCGGPQGASARSGTAAAPAGSASIRVPVQKVDALIDLIGEMVIAQSMMHDVVKSFSTEKLGRLRDAAAQMQRNTREIQERVMSIRMVPVADTFNRFPRMVRDVANQLGKKVRLEISGEETELDKNVVERIGDPLNHLIRNAIDHGLELPDDRVAAGKPATGTIRLRAFTEGGNVVVEIADDGKGLDVEKIRAKAVERGLLEADQKVAPERLQAMIFEPAFSTADKVSDLSGRGVGMDVVKRNVEALSGAIGIESRPGEGTTFRVKLPLTLAILDGLTLALGRETFIVPLLSVTESMRPTPDMVETIRGGEAAFVMVRGEPVPIVRMHRLLGVDGAVDDPCRGIVTLVEHEGRRAALLVDALLGLQQVVIKSLRQNYRSVEHVLGATILGDGSVALILDVGSVVARLRDDAPAAR